jgi:fumarylacetoacetate (FAA) hydrolase family protein
MRDVVRRVRSHRGERLALLENVLETSTLLAPCDLQAIKAAGVTFADSLVERVNRRALQRRPRPVIEASHGPDAIRWQSQGLETRIA